MAKEDEYIVEESYSIPLYVYMCRSDIKLSAFMDEINKAMLGLSDDVVANANIQFDTPCYDDPSEYALIISWTRPMTPWEIEAHKRAKAEAEAAERDNKEMLARVAEARERQEYARLHAKYGVGRALDREGL